MHMRIAGLAVALALGAACGTPGQSGNFTFYDTTLSADALPAASALNRSVAVGAALTIEVRDGSENGPGTLFAEIIDGDAFDILGEGSRVAVVALAEGTSTLEVTSADGTTDQVDLTAAKLDHVELYPWADTIVSYGEPEETVFALAPYGRIGLNGRMFDVDGSRLTGTGLFDFGGDTAALTVAPFETYANGAYLAWDGISPADVVLTGGQDASFPLRLLSPEASLTLSVVFDSNHTEDAGVITATGPTLIGSLRLYDDGGRRVMPRQADRPTWSVVAGDEGLLVPTDPTDEVFGPDTGTFLTPVCPGSATVKVDYAGATTQVRLIVIGDPGADCAAP